MRKIFKMLSQASATFVLIVLVTTVVVLYINAKPALEEFGSYFVLDDRWGVEIQTGESSSTPDNNQSVSSQQPVKDISQDFDAGIDDIDTDDDFAEDDELNTSSKKVVYGAAIPIIGTIFSTAIAMLFAIPIAMGIAVFLSEIASEKLASPVGVAIELLAAIPSIIYGMWALFYFGPFISKVFGGYSVSLLVAGLVLGVMIIPFMAALSRDAMKTTPNVLKESAYALGATKFEVTKDIVFTYAKAGIIGSIIISLGRAMGETMAVAFVIGGVFKMAEKITDPTNSIPVTLANNFAESSGMSMSVLFYLALILFVVSFITIFLSKYYFLRRNKL